MPPRKTYSSKPAGAEPDEDVISTEGVSFTLDDVEFTCHGELDGQDMIDLAVPMADAGDGWFDPEALAAVGRFMRQVMGEDTYRAFAAHRRRHRTRQQVVADIMMDLVQEITARPPGKPSPSPSGPPPTGPSSLAGSPSPERAMRSPAAGGAVDPGGIIPPEMAEAAEVVLAAPPVPGQEHPDPMAGMHRTINLGDAARTRVEPADVN
jgi:hypothetical protein